jgi:PAS domain S-box-containing protein
MIADTKSESEGVLIINDKGLIILINQSATNLFGYSGDELINASINTIMKDGMTLIPQHAIPSPNNKLSADFSNDLKGIKKGGVEFGLQINSSQFKGGNELFTVAFVLETVAAQEVVNLNDRKLTPVVFLILDKSFNISVVNNYGCTFLGAGKEQLNGLNWFESFLPIGYTQQIQSIFNKAVITGKIENYETPVVTLRGERYTILWTTRVIYDSTGAAVATLSTGVDSGKEDQRIDLVHQERIKKLNELLETRVSNQTDELLDSLSNFIKVNQDLQLQIQRRISIEEKLIKIQRLYDRMVHHFPDGVIGVIDRELKYLLLDGKEIHDINLPAIGLIKSGSTEPRDPILEEEMLAKLMKAFEGESVSFEAKTSDRCYHISAEPLPDSQNNINEILCVLKNVTERKKLEANLREALEKEQELGELKSRFVTLASHEFKTPLSIILSSAFLLENYKGADYEKEKLVHINRIKRSVNSLTAILNEFLSLETHREKRIIVTPTEVNILNFLSELILEIDPLRKEGQVIDYHHLGENQICQLDTLILWSILTNLISNALKYSKEGDQINVTSSIDDHQLTIIVKDSGMGIPAEEQKNIFGLFYRASNSLNYKGTGLGLHIVEKNIKLLNGTIRFTSELNVGSEFTIVLPSESYVINKLNNFEESVL